MVKILIMILMYFIHLISFAHSTNKFKNETFNQINPQERKLKSAVPEASTFVVASQKIIWITSIDRISKSDLTNLN